MRVVLEKCVAQVLPGSHARTQSKGVHDALVDKNDLIFGGMWHEIACEFAKDRMRKIFSGWKLLRA